MTNSSHHEPSGTMETTLVTVVAMLLLTFGSGVVLDAVAVIMSAPLGGVT